jgi:hypothetical protein
MPSIEALDDRLAAGESPHVSLEIRDHAQSESAAGVLWAVLALAASVGFSSDSRRIAAQQRTAAAGQERTLAPQQKCLYSITSVARRRVNWAR